MLRFDPVAPTSNEERANCGKEADCIALLQCNLSTKPARLAKPELVDGEPRGSISLLLAPAFLIELPEDHRFVSAINAHHELVGVIELGVLLSAPAP
jgi:hypothetical protein